MRLSTDLAVTQRTFFMLLFLKKMFGSSLEIDVDVCLSFDVKSDICV